MIMGIPLYLTDYRELIDTRGRLSAEISAVIFQQMGIDEDQWLTMTQQFGQGSTQRIRSYLISKYQPASNPPADVIPCSHTGNFGLQIRESKGQRPIYWTYIDTPETKSS